MTEQQILDKTIEYLNKYSNCFKNWQIRFDTNKMFKLVCIYYGVNFDTDLVEEHKQSEFRIAYNIIKDLAQNSTNDNAINALG